VNVIIGVNLVVSCLVRANCHQAHNKEGDEDHNRKIKDVFADGVDCNLIRNLEGHCSDQSCQSHRTSHKAEDGDEEVPQLIHDFESLSVFKGCNTERVAAAHHDSNGDQDQLPRSIAPKIVGVSHLEQVESKGEQAHELGAAEQESV